MVHFVRESLRGLDYLEELIRDCSAPVKDQIQTLRIELRFLRVFFICAQGKIIYGNEGLEKQVSKLEAVTRDVLNVIRSRYLEAKQNGEVAVDLDGSMTYMLKAVELIKPEVDQCYHHISQLEYYDYNLARLNELNEGLLANIKDLLQYSEVNSVVEAKKLIDILERRLLFLRNSLQLLVKLKADMWTINSDFGYETTTVASFFFRCWMNRLDENNELPDLSLALNNRINREQAFLYLEIKNSFAREYSSEESLIVSYIDFLLQHLAEVLSRDPGLENRTRDQLESLHEELKLLKSLPFRTLMGDDERGMSFDHHTEVHLNRTAFLIEDIYVGNTNEEKNAMISNDILPQVLGGLTLINLLYKMESVNHELILVAPVKDPFQTIREDIQLLRAYFINTHKGDDEVEKKFMDVHSQIYALALEAAPTLYYFYINETKEDITEEMISLLPNLLEKFKLIKEAMGNTILRASSSNLLKTGQRGMETSLKQLIELLTKRANTLSSFVNPSVRKSVELWIEYVQNKLELLISFLAKVEEQCIDIGEVITLEIRITSMANAVDYVTDPNFIRDNPDWIYILKFSALMDEINLMNEEMERLNAKVSGELLSSQDNALLLVSMMQPKKL